jgi:hypothetical protein
MLTGDMVEQLEDRNSQGGRERRSGGSAICRGLTSCIDLVHRLGRGSRDKKSHSRDLNINFDVSIIWCGNLDVPELVRHSYEGNKFEKMHTSASI